VDDSADLSASRLLGNEPNPFGATTMIRFTTAAAAEARIAIFDVGGRQVRLLNRGIYQPGSHRIEWDGRDDNGNELPSGVYFTRLTAGGETSTRAVLLAH
jgi:flagellar hook assembly protein FlgD